MHDVIRFLQADEILGYLAEEANSRLEFLLHDKAHLHIARQIQALLREQFHWDIFEHPPYSPYLATSDVFLFPKMKEHRDGKRFTIYEDLKDPG